MSIRERISRILRKSNASASSASDSDRKTSKKSLGRMLSRRSKPSKSTPSSKPGSNPSANPNAHSSPNSNPSSNSNPHSPTTPRSTSGNTACTSIASNRSYPVPENVEGLRWEDMTPSQRITANFNAYEMRFGSSRRISMERELEGISPCNTRVMPMAMPPSSGND